MIHVLIVQEACALRDQMINVLSGEPDLTIIGCVSSSQDALTLVKRHPCDLLLVDASLPESGALAVLQYLEDADVPRLSLIFGVPENPETILYWLEEGANGYVGAREGWAELVKKIHAVCEGEFWVPPEIAAALMTRIAELKQLASELDGSSATITPECYAELTQREWEVLCLLGQELSNQEIAEALTIELGTVKNHVHNLLRKLDVTSRKQAAQLARQLFGNQYAEAQAGLAVPIKPAPDQVWNLVPARP
jgi:DNA-binding NarL/FixJ family response regulator